MEAFRYLAGYIYCGRKYHSSMGTLSENVLSPPESWYFCWRVDRVFVLGRSPCSFTGLAAQDFAMGNHF